MGTLPENFAAKILMPVLNFTMNEIIGVFITT
jgi:hypothetical protein